MSQIILTCPPDDPLILCARNTAARNFQDNILERFCSPPWTSSYFLKLHTINTFNHYLLTNPTRALPLNSNLAWIVMKLLNSYRHLKIHFRPRITLQCQSLALCLLNRISSKDLESVIYVLYCVVELTDFAKRCNWPCFTYLHLPHLCLSKDPTSSHLHHPDRKAASDNHSIH
jgi:hypothetical protein